MDTNINNNFRANALADRLEQGAGALISFAQNMSESEWNMTLSGGGRKLGVIVHHVASVYPVEIELAQLLASGQPITGATWEVIDNMNGEHAKEFDSVSKEETLELLRNNSKAAAESLRGFSDKELDSSATVSLNSDAPLTAQFFIEDHALRHSFHHLAQLKDALNR
ncbi:MAG: DinB family protein [Acidobacteriota bacterium]